MISTALMISMLAATPPALIGTWVAESDPSLVLDLREDGLAEFFLGAWFWTADDKTLRLDDPSQADERPGSQPAAPAPYQLSGDRLTVKLEKLTVAFARRQGTARAGPVATPRWLGKGLAETTSGRWFRQYRQNQRLLVTSEYHWVPGAEVDRSTMKTVCGLTVDASHVYDNGSTLPNIDAATFHELGRGFCADRTSVRVGSAKQVWLAKPGAPPRDFDVATFEPLLGGLVKDQNGVYARVEYWGAIPSELVGRNSYRVDGWERLDGPDPATFETPTDGTARDRHAEYRLQSQAVPSKRLVVVRPLSKGPASEPGAPDPGSEQNLGCGFTRVRDSIFWTGTRLPGADPRTFQLLFKGKESSCAHGWYGRDAQHVFFQAKQVEGADPKTITLLDGVENNAFAFDEKHRYDHGEDIDRLRDAKGWGERFERALSKWKGR